jgi:membrane fusion protein (multidrug efflux system)
VDHESVLVSFHAVDRLQLIFTIQSAGFALGRQGDVIHARVFTYPGERFPGEVFFISPTVDPSTRRMILKAWVSNIDHRLKPGMFANVDVEIARRDNALVLPETALVYDRSGTYVWRLNEDQRAEKIPVQIGLRQKGTVEIVEGLAAKDMVVVVGTHKVTAGSALVNVAVAPEAHAVGPHEKQATPEGQGEAS